MSPSTQELVTEHMPDTQQQSEPVLQASSRVLGIPELLEKILLGDKSLQILRCQRVCRDWEACIKTSLRVQRKIFMRAGPVTRVWGTSSTSRQDDKYEGIIPHTHPEGLHAEWQTALRTGDLRNLPTDWQLMPEQRCLTATRYVVERFDDSTLWPFHIIPVMLNTRVLAHPVERKLVESIEYDTLQQAFHQPVTFTVHSKGSTALSWRWMLLTNPPCKSITIHPYTARSYEPELVGVLFAQEEMRRSKDSMTIFNESGIRVRDVMRAFDTCRTVVQPGMSFKIHLNGVVCPTTTDCIAIKAASAEQQEKPPWLMGLSLVDDTQEKLSLDGICPRLDDAILEPGR